MRLDRLKTFALALRQTTVVRQWGGLVFKVADKVFFMINLDGAVMTGVIFKCTPAEFAGLVEIDGIGQAPYFAKRLWVHIEDPAVLPDKELQAHIRRSYGLVVDKLPKKIQASLQAD